MPRMTRTMLCVLGGAALVGLVFAALAVGRGQVSHAALPKVADCSNEAYGGAVKPRAWSTGCTGSSLNVTGIRWSSYSSTVARGKGIGGLNPCDPDCASSRALRYPTKLKMTRARSCTDKDGASRLFFTRATVSILYPRGNPFGKKPGWRSNGTYPATQGC